jgi:hypothetical protein
MKNNIACLQTTRHDNLQTADNEDPSNRDSFLYKRQYFLPILRSLYVRNKHFPSTQCHGIILPVGDGKTIY